MSLILPRGPINSQLNEFIDNHPISSPAGETMLNSSIERLEQIPLMETLFKWVEWGNQTKKQKKSYFRIINALYIWENFNLSKKREHNFPSVASIAKTAGCSVRSVQNFISSPEFQIYCDIKKEKFSTHTYRLKDWVFEWFRLFWRSGMMKGFKQKSKYWASDFYKRLKNWIVPLIEAGKTIRDIFNSIVNRLSTKKSSKLHPPSKPNCTLITYQEGINKHTGSEDTDITLESIQTFTKMGDVLLTRFHIREPDVNFVINYFSLSHIKRAVRLAEDRLKRTRIVKSPIKFFQHCLNQTKGRK